MALRVVGAGLGRTGTLSLKAALEKLLAGRCYHMMEVFEHPEHLPRWTEAARGEAVDWQALLEGYVAAVDWPASAFWPELAAQYPNAIVLLSHRSASSWWKSVNATIFPTAQRAEGAWREMLDALYGGRFTTRLDDERACVDAFEAHNERVRAAGLGPRLVEWQPGDGWAPLCAALDLPVPEEPFPHSNSTEQFLARAARHVDT